MEDFLKDIYKYADLIFKIKQIILHSHYGYDSNINPEWTEITPTIVEFCQLIAQKDVSLGNLIFSKIEEATHSSTLFPSNYSKFADSLEELLPIFYTAIASLGKIDVSDDEYELVSSKSGFLSLVNAQTGYQYTSVIDPMTEAFEHSQRIYNPHYSEFHFLGVELGYLPYQIFKLSNECIDIHIYHISQKAIDYSSNFGVLNWISNSKLHIHVYTDEYELLYAFSSTPLNSKVGTYIYPDMVHCLSKKYNEIAKSSYISDINYYSTLDIKNANAFRNLFNHSKWLNDFHPRKKTSTWSIISGGPSLDDRMDYLKDNQYDMNIICATTVLKKLLDYGIYPDCIASNDPKNRTYGHFKDISNINIPLLLAINSNWQFGEYYQGPVFLVPTLSDFSIEAIITAAKQTPIYSGRNISTLSTSIAIFFKAQTINLFGVDFSYSTGYTHASGTMDYEAISTDGMITVPGVNGQPVLTTPQFILYINELNDLITSNPQINFINYSTNGAYIKGAKWFN